MTHFSCRYEPKLGKEGGSDTSAHMHRVQAVDKVAELDDIIAKYHTNIDYES